MTRHNAHNRLPAVCIALLATVCAAAAAGVADAATRCVGRAPTCSPTIQGAIDLSRDGNTIRIGPGTFAGGVTITRRISVRGAGAAATTIRGGGPVVTIGDPAEQTQPTVSISGLTLTGGVTHGQQFRAGGGGIFVWFGADFTPGATVALHRVTVAGNRVEPTTTIPEGPPCPSGPCPYAQGDGGGIDTFGSMSITDSVIRDNTVGGVASDAAAGSRATSARCRSPGRSCAATARSPCRPTGASPRAEASSSTRAS